MASENTDKVVETGRAEDSCKMSIIEGSRLFRGNQKKASSMYVRNCIVGPFSKRLSLSKEMLTGPF
jgi:hypothetical protein